MMMSTATKTCPKDYDGMNNDEVRIVLLCSGNGADVNSYRPRRDVSQWWNRRDALVRCVASFLFAPASNDCGSRRELVFLYDGDYTRIHMKRLKTTTSPMNQSGPKIFPSEFHVISLWKDAISKALKQQTRQAMGGVPKRSSRQLDLKVQRGDLICWAILNQQQGQTSDGTGPVKRASSSSSSSVPQAISDSWSKRQLLEYLQNTCSMEFLREHKLNCSSDVILRKSNRGALKKVYQSWIKTTTTSKKNNKKSKAAAADKDENSQLQVMKLVFEDILYATENSHPVTQTESIAATLHESSDSELPCYGKIKEEDHSYQTPRSLCLFLGAVRDMTKIEYRALEMACCRSSSKNEQNQNNGDRRIPLVKIRLSSVPEFTSKILSVVAFHHNNQRLGIGMSRLVKMKKMVNPYMASLSQTSNQNKKLLHILAIIPLASDVVKVYDTPEKRPRELWCLVRVIVNSLWRSKLAGGKHSPEIELLENALTLVFEDGFYLTIHQNGTFISNMANQHQAAPSEYQILTAILNEIQHKRQEADGGDSKTSKRKKTKASQDWWNQRASEIVSELLENENPISGERNVLLVLDHGNNAGQALTYDGLHNSNDIVKSFYDLNIASGENDTATSPSYIAATDSLLAIVPISSSSSPALPTTTATTTMTTTNIIQSAFLGEFRKTNSKIRYNTHCQYIAHSTDSPTNDDRVDSDWEASMIIMLQHFFYQNRLVFVNKTHQDGNVTTSSSKKRKVIGGNDDLAHNKPNMGLGYDSDDDEQRKRKKRKKSKKERKPKMRK